MQQTSILESQRLQILPCMSNDLGTPIFEITSHIDTIVVHIIKTNIVIMEESEEECLKKMCVKTDHTI